ncbi:hypothetical protein BH10ACT11_BH10ACT11_13070 [soil metagenome]
MTFDPRRRLRSSGRRDGDVDCASERAVPSELEQREESSRAIHKTSVQMLTRMAEALEGKNAKAREALAQAAQRAARHS